MVLEQLKERFKGDPHRLLRKDGTPVGLRVGFWRCKVSDVLKRI